MTKTLFLTGYLIGNIYKYSGLKYEFEDYLNCNSYEEFKGKLNPEYDIAIGYSLGGRILLRLISEQHIKVKKLYVIAAPYFVHQTEEFRFGMSEATFCRLGQILSLFPEKLFNLVLKILYYIGLLPNKNWSLNKIKYWYNFLRIPFPLNLPQDIEVIVIHGDKDWIVNVENARYLAHKLSAKLIVLKNIGHLIIPFKIRKLLKA